MCWGHNSRGERQENSSDSSVYVFFCCSSCCVCDESGQLYAVVMVQCLLKDRHIQSYKNIFILLYIHISLYSTVSI